MRDRYTHTLGHTLNAKETNSFAYLCSILCLLSHGRRCGACRQLRAPLSLLVLQEGSRLSALRPPGRLPAPRTALQAPPPSLRPTIDAPRPLVVDGARLRAAPAAGCARCRRLVPLRPPTLSICPRAMQLAKLPQLWQIPRIFTATLQLTILSFGGTI